jgi:hypothetical protein
MALEEAYVVEFNPVLPVETQPTFRRNLSHTSSGFYDLLQGWLYFFFYNPFNFVLPELFSVSQTSKLKYFNFFYSSK